MNDSFFGKNGTLNSLMNFAKDYSEGVSKGYQSLQSMQSGNAIDRLKTLVDTAGSILAMFL